MLWKIKLKINVNSKSTVRAKSFFSEFLKMTTGKKKLHFTLCWLYWLNSNKNKSIRVLKKFFILK